MTSMPTVKAASGPAAGWPRRTMGLALGAALLAAGLGGTSRAHAAPVDLTVVDRDTGAPLQVWRYRGRLFVAGRPGARYALRVTNNTDRRVLVVLSVDGVNIISGETAAYDQRGYVFDPRQSYDLAGWRKSDSEIAAFFFASLPHSYAALTGRPRNVGVIGMAVFREKPQPPPPPPVVMNQSAGAWGGAPAPAPAARAESSSAAATEDLVVTAQRKAEKLGTGHGQVEQSYVTTVDFERATPYPQYVCRIDYDSYENLAAIGVIPRAWNPPPRPQPFPERPSRDGYVPDPPVRW